MKTTMKKLAAVLLVLILAVQVMPVLADTVISPVQKPIDNFREKLEVKSPATVILVGATVDLTATEGYSLTWESKPEDVAEVDASGRVSAKAPGIVRITASEGSYKDSVVLQVVEKENTSEETMTIVINASKEKITYDGKEHVSGFTASSNAEGFNADNVKINEEKRVVAKDCGVYPIKYNASDFSYEGKDDVEFIVSEGWFQIKPAALTIKANDITVQEGDEPEFTATITGLMEGDDPESIQYSFEVFTSGETTYVAPVCEAIQGNYRITKLPGVMTVENGTYRAIRLTSDWPEGQPAYAGTMITMTAELIGFENLNYTLQWQYSIDQKEWTDEPGANGTSFTFELNETTVQYTWRVVANY